MFALSILISTNVRGGEKIEVYYSDDDLFIILTTALDSKSKELDVKQSTSLLSSKQELSKENELYLSQMNKDISAKIKELANIVKNRRII